MAKRREVDGRWNPGDDAEERGIVSEEDSTAIAIAMAAYYED
jgi:hypothetical protein